MKAHELSDTVQSVVLEEIIYEERLDLQDKEINSLSNHCILTEDWVGGL